MLKKFLTLVLLLLISSQVLAQPSETLTDITGHPHETSIRTIVDLGLWPIPANQTTFNPDTPLVLGDQVTLLLKAANLYEEASSYSGGQCPQTPLFSYAVSKRIFTTTSCPSMGGKRTIGNLITTGIKAFKLSNSSASTEFTTLVNQYSGPSLGTNKKPYGIALNEFKFSWEVNALVDFDPAIYLITSTKYPSLAITRGQAADLIVNMFALEPPTEEEIPDPNTAELDIISPTPGTQLNATDFTLSWRADGAESFDIAVGSSSGSPDYGWYGGLATNSVLIEDLPDDGSSIFIRIFAYYPNETIVRDYQYTATEDTGGASGSGTTGGTTGGGATTAEISPASGNTLSGSTQIFSWNSQGAIRFDVALGSSIASPNFGWYGDLSQNTLTASNLPTDGSSVWMRIFYYMPDGSSFGRDYSFVAAASGGTTTGGSGGTGGTTGGSTGGSTGGNTGGTSGGGVASGGSCANPFGTPGTITSAWANEGGDKVVQEDTRGSCNPNAVINSVWDGSKIKLFGAKNEVVNFNLILEAALGSVSNVNVAFNQLSGPNGSVIDSLPANGDQLFNWVDRDIELFYVRYLEIKGLSAFVGLKYDERHIPDRLQRPWTGEGYGTGSWTDRPDHNKHYPDIAVPLEMHPGFTIADKNNQAIWGDIYIPKNTNAGTYTGSVQIQVGGQTVKTIPVELEVYNFSLPDTPKAKSMLFMGYGDINNRYLNNKYPDSSSDLAKSLLIRNRHFLLAHRHKIALIDSDGGANDAPSSEWIPRLNGSLFTAANGYRGPGEGMGNGIYSIGTYGSWGWQSQGESGMWQHTNNWVNWFNNNAPDSEYFLYLIDESPNYAQIEQWAAWIDNNPGIGKNMPSMATTGVVEASKVMRSLDIPTTGMYTADKEPFDTAMNYYNNTPGKKVYFYNGGRPGNGSFMIDDDGIALRELAWGQFKKNIDRWFYWESTYYNNFQAGMGETNVFQKAHTFGGYSSNDSVLGEYGWNYSNGDGVLFYPGTDKVFPAESYNLNGPIASLRLKHWRRGIQDADYLELAKQKDPSAVDAIVQRMVPKAMWENDVTDPNDPTWVRAAVSWSNDPELWEAARKELAEIIIR